eukprot:15466482-Alexandrium_andersonii.AAC.1
MRGGAAAFSALAFKACHGACPADCEPMLFSSHRMRSAAAVVFLVRASFATASRCKRSALAACAAATRC